MSEVIDPRDASIDGLIDWLSRKRRLDATSPLAYLIGDRNFDQQRLVDIACIDLMQRRRMQHDVGVESYLAEFPCLDTESDRLDLIDAELCVAKELGTSVELAPYLDRFPNMAEQIKELFELEIEAQPTPAVMETAIADDESGDPVKPHANATCLVERDDFSVDLPGETIPQRFASPLEHPVDIPDWFVVAQCVGSGPGRWLIRGRDSVRGMALALKITELPTHLSTLQAEQLLDACEVASRVRNPCWIKPSVAAIQERHLGVIRPWLHARPWQICKSEHDPGTQLRKLSSVAFALESAHRVGATHGGIHVENLMVDHTGKVQVLDAGSSRIGLGRWLNSSDKENNSEQIAPLEERIQVDVQDLIKLVAATAVDWQYAWSMELIADLRRIAREDEGPICGEIGQRLIRGADDFVPNTRSGSTPRPKRRSWRKRLARWIDGGS